MGWWGVQEVLIDSVCAKNWNSRIEDSGRGKKVGFQLEREILGDQSL